MSFSIITLDIATRFQQYGEHRQVTNNNDRHAIQTGLQALVFKSQTLAINQTPPPMLLNAYAFSFQILGAGAAGTAIKSPSALLTMPAKKAGSCNRSSGRL